MRERTISRVATGIVVALLVGVIGGVVFTVVDPPGVENVVDALDTDSAAAGRTVKYQCDLGPLPREVRTMRYGIGKYQQTKNAAMASAIKAGLKPGWKVFRDPYTREVIVSKTGTNNPWASGAIVAQITCWFLKAKVT